LRVRRQRRRRCPSLRREVFTRSALARAALAVGVSFDREAVLEEAALALGLDRARLEAGLYADLRSAERLLKAPFYLAPGLLERHARAEVQAVLLCSVRVVVEVLCASAEQYRSLFQKAEVPATAVPNDGARGGGYRIEIDGPYSLFESVTKYGLELALLLPALESCDRVKLTADLRWGKKREKLTFRARARSRRGLGAEPAAGRDPSAARGLRRERTCGRPAGKVWNPPGIAVRARLVLHQPAHRRAGIVQVLGFWNRDAVWPAVELVSKGVLGEGREQRLDLVPRRARLRAHAGCELERERELLALLAPAQIGGQLDAVTALQRGQEQRELQAVLRDRLEQAVRPVDLDPVAAALERRHLEQQLPELQLLKSERYCSALAQSTSTTTRTEHNSTACTSARACRSSSPGAR